MPAFDERPVAGCFKLTPAKEVRRSMRHLVLEDILQQVQERINQVAGQNRTTTDIYDLFGDPRKPAANRSEMIDVVRGELLEAGFSIAYTSGGHSSGPVFTVRW